MLLFDLQHQRSIKTSPGEFWWAAPGSIQVSVKSWVHPSVTQYSCSSDPSIKLHVFMLSCSVLLLCYQITAASQVSVESTVWWHRSTWVRWRYVSGNMLTQAKTDCEHPPAADTASSTSTQVFHHSGHVSTRPQRTQLWCSSTCGLFTPTEKSFKLTDLQQHEPFSCRLFFWKSSNRQHPGPDGMKSTAKAVWGVLLCATTCRSFNQIN